MTFSAQRLSEPLILEQDVIDPTWHRALLIGFIIAAILVFYVYGEKMFLWGRAGQPVQPQAAIQQPIIAAAAASQPPATSHRSTGGGRPERAPLPTVSTPTPLAPAELTPEELDRRHSEYLRKRDR